ncbi:hypothetical protein NE237_019771 [Protea cynaroides]|uniref:Uncharacterized protein n=1 Tax=Protea cynaroides TaxID=273540 RepID=A0A9Q0H761_9MAGN|nr:hypothetical protein NE237_019771 [Protea cynaroides]
MLSIWFKRVLDQEDTVKKSSAIRISVSPGGSSSLYGEDGQHWLAASGQNQDAVADLEEISRRTRLVRGGRGSVGGSVSLHMEDEGIKSVDTGRWRFYGDLRSHLEGLLDWNQGVSHLWNTAMVDDPLFGNFGYAERVGKTCARTKNWDPVGFFGPKRTTVSHVAEDTSGDVWWELPSTVQLDAAADLRGSGKQADQGPFGASNQGLPAFSTVQVV